MIPARGDILHIQFDPASGRELKGDHYCLVVSAKAFNARFKLAMVCPISSGVSPHAREAGSHSTAGIGCNIVSPHAREAGFLVPIMGTGSRLVGSVHCHQLKTIDWEARKAVFYEKAAEVVMQEVINCIIPVLDDD